VVPTFKSKKLITDLYSMDPPDSRDITFLPPHIMREMVFDEENVY
jgi:hypothetical protein